MTTVEIGRTPAASAEDEHPEQEPTRRLDVDSSNASPPKVKGQVKKKAKPKAKADAVAAQLVVPKVKIKSAGPAEQPAKGGTNPVRKAKADAKGRPEGVNPPPAAAQGDGEQSDAAQTDGEPTDGPQPDRQSTAEPARGRLARTVHAPVRLARRSGKAGIAAVVVVLLLATAVCAWGWSRSAGTTQDLQHTNSLRASAARAASTYTTDLTTYDYRNLGAQQSKLNAEASAKFRQTFTDSSKTLGPIFTQLHATAAGKVLSVAVQNVSDSSAVALVFVDQLANSTKLKSPQTQPSRLRVTLVRSGGRWLLDSVDLV